MGKIIKNATTIGTNGRTVIRKTAISTIRTAVGSARNNVMKGDNKYATHLYILANITNPRAIINDPAKHAIVCAQAINIANQL
jgi:hypothetical protein